MENHNKDQEIKVNVAIMEKDSMVQERELYSVRRRGLIRDFILMLIRSYRRVLSPLLGDNCRFYPSCSHYTELNFEYLPLLKAFSLSLWRIVRCNPLGSGGTEYPPVPHSKCDHEI